MSDSNVVQLFPTGSHRIIPEDNVTPDRLFDIIDAAGFKCEIDPTGDLIIGGRHLPIVLSVIEESAQLLFVTFLEGANLTADLANSLNVRYRLVQFALDKHDHIVCRHYMTYKFGVDGRHIINILRDFDGICGAAKKRLKTGSVSEGLTLFGSSKMTLNDPDGREKENLFIAQQSVSIGLLQEIFGAAGHEVEVDESKECLYYERSEPTIFIKLNETDHEIMFAAGVPEDEGPDFEKLNQLNNFLSAPKFYLCDGAALCVSYLSYRDGIISSHIIQALLAVKQVCCMLQASTDEPTIGSC